MDTVADVRRSLIDGITVPSFPFRDLHIRQVRRERKVVKRQSHIEPSVGKFIQTEKGDGQLEIVCNLYSFVFVVSVSVIKSTYHFSIAAGGRRLRSG